MNKPGLTEAIIGLLFSGKTTELLRPVEQYSHQKSCVVVKHACDLRYSSTHVVSHDEQSLEAIGTIILDASFEKMAQYDVVGELCYFAFHSYHLNECSEIVPGIDERQLVDDIVEMCEQLPMAGKVVMVAARIGNHHREGYKKSLEPIFKRVRC